MVFKIVRTTKTILQVTKMMSRRELTKRSTLKISLITSISKTLSEVWIYYVAQADLTPP